MGENRCAREGNVSVVSSPDLAFQVLIVIRENGKMAPKSHLAGSCTDEGSELCPFGLSCRGGGCPQRSCARWDPCSWKLFPSGIEGTHKERLSLKNLSFLGFWCSLIITNWRLVLQPVEKINWSSARLAFWGKSQSHLQNAGSNVNV